MAVVVFIASVRVGGGGEVMGVVVEGWGEGGGRDDGWGTDGTWRDDEGVERAEFREPVTFSDCVVPLMPPLGEERAKVLLVPRLIILLSSLAPSLT